ncbi:hypothetical protein ACON3F_04800 [Providencia hangzhouensis]|uniref:hypothetical protein n=2 Tax=Morganellaceae TaxID=1903414 RepID=UPI001A27C4DF|nr:hypothetical protein [Providencia sp. PROV099]WOB96896.1 hypothetical protein P3L54_08860 [Providencia sp. PROV099]
MSDNIKGNSNKRERTAKSISIKGPAILAILFFIVVFITNKLVDKSFVMIIQIPVFLMFVVGVVSYFSVVKGVDSSNSEHLDNNENVDVSAAIELEKVKNEIKDKIDSLGVFKDQDVEGIVKSIKDNLASNEISQKMIGFFNESINRMRGHVQKLNYLSILNLTIGIAISGFAIGILYLSISEFSQTAEWSQKDTFYLFSRIAIGIAIQLLALFFLNLYKANIQEMKYSHNEITNIESKKIAFIYSISFSEENKLLMAKELINTERNFILTKNQTTMQIEQMKIDQQGAKTLMEIIESLIKNKK